MKTIKFTILSMVAALALGSCQDKDYVIAAPILPPVDANLITGQLQGDDYVWTWPQSAAAEMEVTVYNGSTSNGTERISGNTYTHRNIDTNIEYTYVFRLTDGKNVSTGAIKRYTRPGAAKMSGLSMAQLDKVGGYDAEISWNLNSTAQNIILHAVAGGRTINTSRL
ncbi:MAG: hypothetical protein K2M00_07310, partial [Muribaculaceae bacterium]|nr:hypothetical protein [Muribaculaceae bacterium]